MRARVKAARAATAATPGAHDVLQRDWIRAARFYAKFGIAETQFRTGVLDGICSGTSNSDGTSLPEHLMSLNGAEGSGCGSY